MKPTVEQSAELARLEQAHRLMYIQPDSTLAEQLDPDSVTGYRGYVCLSCLVVITIDPDGESRHVGVLVPPGPPWFGGYDNREEN